MVAATAARAVPSSAPRRAHRARRQISAALPAQVGWKATGRKDTRDRRGRTRPKQEASRAAARATKELLKTETKPHPPELAELVAVAEALTAMRSSPSSSPAPSPIPTMAALDGPSPPAGPPQNHFEPLPAPAPEHVADGVLVPVETESA